MLSNLFKILYNLGNVLYQSPQLFKTLKIFAVLNNLFKRNHNFNDVEA